VWQLVREYAAQVGPGSWRRTIWPDGGEAMPVEGRGVGTNPVQLGHESILTTERYFGSEQDLKNAVKDALVCE